MDEREAIVRWLRAEGKIFELEPGWNAMAQAFYNVADAFERGEHMKEEG